MCPRSDKAIGDEKIATIMSVVGPTRHVAPPHNFGRERGTADIAQSIRARCSVATDPKATSLSNSPNCDYEVVSGGHCAAPRLQRLFDQFGHPLHDRLRRGVDFLDQCRKVLAVLGLD